MKRETLKNGATVVLEYAKKGGAIIVPILLTMLANRANNICERYIEEKRYPSEPDYGDAMKAISESDMFSSDKTRAIGLVEKDQSPSYYKAVMATMYSDQFSSDKIRSLKALKKDE